MALLVLLFAVGNIRFFVDPELSTALQSQVYIDNAMMVRIHIFAGTFSVFTGPFQFWAGFRNRHRKWHRLMGKFYLGGAVFGVSSAFYIAGFPLAVSRRTSVSLPWLSAGAAPRQRRTAAAWIGWVNTLCRRDLHQLVPQPPGGRSIASDRGE